MNDQDTPPRAPKWATPFGILCGVLAGFGGVYAALALQGSIRQAGPAIPVGTAVVTLVLGAAFQARGDRLPAALLLGVCIGSLLTMPVVCLAGPWHGS